MNMNQTNLLLEQNMMHVKDEMEYEYKDHNLYL